MTETSKTNLNRAEWARTAVDAFAREVGNDNEPLEVSINDLICDLGHLADREQLDFVAILTKAVAFWKIEQIDPDGIADPPPVDLIIGSNGGRT